MPGVGLDDCKVVLYRNQPSGWVAEVHAIDGCYALMPTGNKAMAELAQVFAMIEAEYLKTGKSMPADSSETVNT